jgi:putative cell wall-binding protein
MNKRKSKLILCLLLSFMMIFSNITVSAEVNQNQDANIVNFSVLDTLDFSPKDTVMDESQPVLYMTDYGRRQVVSYNLETKSKKVVQFQLQPENLCLAGGKLYVALLKGPHNSQNFGEQTGAIGVIDVQSFNTDTPKAEEIFDIDLDPYGVAVDKYGYIYVSSGSGQHTNMNSYNLKTKQKVSSAYISQLTRIYMNPKFNKIYAGYDILSSYTFSNGVLERHEYEDIDYRVREDFAISPDGKYIFVQDGGVFTCYPETAGDMVHIKQLYPYYSSAKGIAFDMDNRVVYEALNNEIETYDYDNLKDVSNIYSGETSDINVSYIPKHQIEKIFYKPGEIITLTKDDKGIAYLEKVKTKPILKPPGIVNASFSDKAMNLPLINEYTVTFNQNITLNNKSQINFYGWFHEIPITTDVSGNKLIIHFGEPLDNVTGYSLAVRPGAVKNESGISNSSSTFIDFTTGSSSSLDEGPKQFVLDREKLTSDKVIEGDLIINSKAALIVENNTSLTVKGNLITYGSVINYGNIKIQGNLYTKYTKDNPSPSKYDETCRFVNMNVAEVEGTTSSDYPPPLLLTNPERDMDIEKGYMDITISTYPGLKVTVNGEEQQNDTISHKSVILKPGANNFDIKLIEQFYKVVNDKTLVLTNVLPPVHINAVYPSDLQMELMPVNIAPELYIDTPKIERYNIDQGISLKEDSTGKSYGLNFEVTNGDDTNPSGLSIIPQEDLNYDDSYTLTIKADSIFGLDGAILDKDYVIKFKTDKEYKRLGGTSRFDTSIKVSEEGWKHSDSVILATGNDFPDALSAAPLARKLLAPILLTNSSSLSPGILDEIDRLGAKKVYVIGGLGAISKNIENELSSHGINCERINGNDRYETAVAIANKIGDSENIVIATGMDFPDALSIAPFAAADKTPILLTPSGKLPQSVKEYIEKHGVKHSTIVGGTGVVSKAVEAELPDVTRLSGKNRYETNFEIVSSKGADATYTFFATGENFPDALAGAAFACYFNSPIVLVGSHMDSEILDTWRYNKDLMKMKYILGGTGALPGEAVYQIFN